MKLSLLFFSFFYIIACSSIVPDDRNIVQVLNEQMKEEMFVGVAIGEYEAGKTKFIGVGKAFLKKDKKINKEQLFDIGSISKVFTGILLASLHLEKVVSLNDPVYLYIPELKNKAAGKITLVELSTHMSGLPRLPSNLGSSNLKDPYGSYDEKKLLSYLGSLKEIKKPKTFSWKNYSNLGVGLLGYALQRASKMSYEELLLKYITKPLEMTNTTVDLKKASKENLVMGYDDVFKESPYWTFKNALVAAGGIKSNVSDMLKFAKANLHPENTSISEALKLAQKPRQHVEKGSSIALGWGVEIEDSLMTGLGHTGGTGGFSSNLQLSFKDDLAIVSLSNSTNHPQCIISIMMLKENCEPHYPQKIDSKILEKYVGTYKSIDKKITFKFYARNGQLIYEVPGQEIGKMKSISDTEFSIAGIASIRFHHDGGQLDFKQGQMEFLLIKESL